MNQISYQNTPIQEIHPRWCTNSGVRLLIKREDQNHPFVSGNKWWKLKYNLVEAQRQNYSTLLTFGGAFSNHIYATAAAAKELGLKSIGVIRGDEIRPLNHTLAFAESCGMKLHFVSRAWYRTKKSAEAQHELKETFGNTYIIPEGGTNEHAVKGCAEFAQKLQEEISFDYLCLSVGTGGTLSGMVEGLDSSKSIIGFSSLKGGDFLHDEIELLTNKTNWKLMTDYHFGGYAKTTPELLDFMKEFEGNFSIPLDQVYTAKMMFGVFDLIKKDFFKTGSTVLMLHSGGLQGRDTLSL